MANKRDLKKLIRNTCGGLALDMITAGDVFPQIDTKDVEKIVTDCAILQMGFLRRLSISFDRAAKDFATRQEYSRARKEYFHKAYAALLEDFDKHVAEVVKEMNAALPDDVRQILKKVANE